MPRYILVHRTASTNSYLAKMSVMLPSGTVVHTPEQTAGRGQRGNSWESEPGKNVLFSMLLKNPVISATEQFRISEAVSLAIVETLEQYTSGFLIKWPNDIYHGDKKVCGILIEHSIMGCKINHTIVGVGINVNQTEFVSDAPNPVSLSQILGCEIPIEEVLHKVCEAVETRCAFESYSEQDFNTLHNEYLRRSYRKDGMFHKFALPDGDVLSARIADVETSGILVLETDSGERKSFAFKEVQFMI